MGGKRSMRTCIACGSILSEEPLMTLDHMPASAQDIPDGTEVASDRGIVLDLCQCPSCGLIQFDCEPVSYYRDVIRAGGFSTTMVELRRRQYRHLIETYGLEGKTFIEVGCGRGEFLAVLKEFPVRAYGIEHKRDLVQIARNEGLSVSEGFTETEDTRIPEGPFDVFLSFNFLEHQPDPGTMLRCIHKNLREGGMGLITVPSLEYILKYDGYYELIHDHIGYYSFETLRFLLEDNGFQVLEEEMVNRDTISMIVKKTDMPGEEERKARAANRKAGPVDISGLKASRHYIDQEVNALVDRIHRDGKTIAIWGASHQGFTLAATTQLGDKVAYIIDSAPFKQGRFAPASHLRIVPPAYFHEEPVDAILIVAPGYTEEIAGIIRKEYGKQVEILALKSNHLETL